MSEMSEVTERGVNDMLKQLYQEMILDHGKSPRNFHVIEGCTHRQEAYNPLCGDRITLYVELHDNEIHDIAFTGQACVICTASASILTEEVKGKMVEQADALFHRFHDELTGKAHSDELGKIGALCGVKAFPMRIKCATLSWHALDHVLHGNRTQADQQAVKQTTQQTVQQTVTTE